VLDYDAVQPPRDPEELEVTAARAGAEIAADTRMGPVHL
jgi:hypothetical protein